jgi:hypothetical protein
MRIELSMVTMSLLLTLASASASGCSRDEPERGPSPATSLAEPGTDARPGAHADPSAAGAEIASETASATETGSDPDDDVIEIEGSGAEEAETSIPVTPITLTPVEVEWTERQRLADPSLELVVVASGVVARARTGAYVLDDDAQQLVLRAGLSVPDHALLGHWPDDVWKVEATPIAPAADGRPRYDYEVFGLDRELHWVAHKYQRQARWSGDALAVRKGWYAGLLVREGSSLTRLGSRKDAPKIGMRMGKLVLDTLETSSGRLYNISLRPNGVYIQPACFKRSCVEAHAKQLPFGSDWSFTDQIPRQRNSFSILAAVQTDGVVSQQLLHYETGGFRLETLVQAPTGLWPTAEGGLWLLVQDQLRYRSPRGEWFAVPSPPDASKLSAAMSADLKTLWVVARVGDEAVVFTTTGVDDA